MSDARIDEQDNVPMDISTIGSAQIDREELENERVDPSSSASETRLIITELILDNFKSYAGVKVIGPFHKRFTSIVGPNGSGKSNVIDALLFVFGKRASKLRLKKVSELIHRSDMYNDVEYAKVEVHFQTIIDSAEDDDGYNIVPNSKITLSRTAYKDNTSKYMLNEKVSTFTEVTNFLKTKGIDLDNNRFLILQGEVEQIAMMKPKGQTEHEVGVLEYLEDIVGTTKYHQPLKEAEERVDQTMRERQVKVNHVKVLEQERNDLVESRTEAVSYLRAERQVLRHQAQLNNFYFQSAFNNAEQLQSTIALLDEEISQAKELEKEMKASRSAMQKEMQDWERKAEKQKEVVDDISKEYSEFEKEYMTLGETLKHEKKECDKLKKKKQKEEEKLEKNRENVRTSATDIEEIQKKTDEELEEKKKMELKREKLMVQVREATEDIRSELEQKQVELRPFRKEVRKWEQEYALQKNELDVIMQRTVKAKEEKGKCEKAMEQVREKMEVHTQTLEEIQVQEGNYKKKMKQHESKLEKCRKKEDLLSEQVGKCQSEIDEFRQARSAATRQSSIIECLTRAKDRGEVQGWYGRLGDLGTIDPKYDVAVTTACGSLNFMVVDTVKTAQRGTEILRQAQAGSTTFIILEKIQYVKKRFDAGRSSSLPSELDRLVDLINPVSPEFEIAFYYALHDTLVAANLDQAVALCQHNGKKHRIVTLEGALLDTSGTMSGGGKTVSRGGMRLSDSASGAVSGSSKSLAEVQKLEEKVASWKNEIRELQSVIEPTLRAFEELKADLSQILTTKQKSEMELDSLNVNMQKLTLQLRQIEGECDLTDKEQSGVEKLEKTAEKSRRSLTKAKKQAETLENQVKTLEEKIWQAGGDKVQEATDRLEELDQSIKQAHSDVTKREIERETATKAIAKIEKVIEKFELRIAESAKNVESMKGKQDELAERAQLLLQDKTQHEEALKEIVEQTKKARDEWNAYEKEWDQAHMLLQEKEKEKSAAKACKAEEVRKSKQWEKEWKAVVARLTEEYQVLSEIENEESTKTRDRGEGKENAEEERYRELSLELSSEEVAQFDSRQCEEILDDLKRQFDAYDPNMEAIEEYRVKSHAYEREFGELEVLTQQRDAMRSSFEQLRQHRLDDFMTGFRIITLKLKEMYQLLTLGGDAELELVDSLDPFSEGIVFSVRPPKKSWKNISNLSGGEKTLSSLALVFALHYYKPTPLYVMDEIDAALDFKNVSIVANYIKERTRNAQFIIISLRNNMFELADRLVGIYKTQNCSKTIAINPDQFVLPAVSE